MRFDEMREMTTNLPSLDGRFVRLEPLVAGHHDDLLRAAADGELWHSKVTVVPNHETMAAYIDKTLAEQTKGKQEPFVIIHKASSRIVGTTRYMNIEESHRRREIGSTWLSASVQRSAVNTETKYLLLRRAFEGHGCIRVEFFTDFLNEQSRAAILRLGAQFEGKLRSHMIVPGGRIRDSMCYSIIAAEWPAVRDRLLARLESPKGAEATGSG